MKEHFYFIGIAGHTIRGLALVAQQHGNQVSGLDEAAVSPGSDWLDEQGIPWSRTFTPSQLDGVTTVVVTGAYATDEYPAIIEARKRGIPVKSWAQLVGELSKGARSIVISGTHGKTTTTSLITWLLEATGRHPDFLVGIRPFNFESSVRIDGANSIVLEGDEYKASDLEAKMKFEYYHPNVLIITSIEHDHPDVYPDLASVIDRFTKVVQTMPRSGRLVVWAGSETVQKVADKASCEVVSYGLESADYVARNTVFLPEGIKFEVVAREQALGELTVPLYGQHNVLNALAATAVTLGEGLSFEELKKAAATFKGTYRRFNILTGPQDAITVIDDYAHHPTEVKTTIEAAKLHFPNRRLIVVFRPHTYSRTKALLSQYHRAFKQADVVYITDVESAREAMQEKNVSGADIVAGVANALFEPDRNELPKRIIAEAKPGDVVLCMSVSGYQALAPELAPKLAEKIK